MDTRKGALAGTVIQALSGVVMAVIIAFAINLTYRSVLTEDSKFLDSLPAARLEGTTKEPDPQPAEGEKPNHRSTEEEGNRDLIGETERCVSSPSRTIYLLLTCGKVVGFLSFT